MLPFLVIRKTEHGGKLKPPHLGHILYSPFFSHITEYRTMIHCENVNVFILRYRNSSVNLNTGEIIMSIKKSVFFTGKVLLTVFLPSNSVRY